MTADLKPYPEYKIPAYRSWERCQLGMYGG